MDQVKLEAFVAVAEEASFGGAADRLRVAQSTISSRIKELESGLGQSLFTRTNRQVRLTAAGEAALPAARRALVAVERVHQVVDEVAGIRRGRVRLGLIAGADIPGLGAALAAFSAQYPAIELVVTSASTADLDRAVSDGRLDLAVVVRTVATSLEWVELLRDPIVAVGLPGAPASVDVRALEGRPIILLDAGAGAREAVLAAARRAGVRLNVAVQVATPGLALELYAEGMGVLVVPGSLAPEPGAVMNGEGRRGIDVHVGVLSYPGGQTPGAELLREHLRASLTLGSGTPPS